MYFWLKLSHMTENTRPPKFIESLIPIVALIALLAFNVFVFKDDATGGPNQIALLFAAVIAASKSASLSPIIAKTLSTAADSPSWIPMYRSVPL